MACRRWGVALSQLVVLVIAPHAHAADERPATAEVQAVRQVVLDYLEGWYTADAARMERALHPELVKRRLRRDEATGALRLQPIDAATMVRLAASGTGKLKDGEVMDNRIEVLDITGEIATASAASLRFVDYLHLARWNGTWKIVNVLWEPRTQTPRAHGQRPPRLLYDQAHGQMPPVPALTALAAKLGVELVPSQHALDATALADADILYLAAPNTEVGAPETAAIVAFVERGGALFLVLDQERRQSLEKTGVNSIIQPFGMRLTADASAPHNCGAVARAGQIHQADREVPYSGGGAVEGATPFSFILDRAGRPTNMAHGACRRLDSGGRIVVLGDGMAPLFLGRPDGVRLSGTSPADSAYWGKDSAAFMEEALRWLAAGKTAPVR